MGRKTNVFIWLALINLAKTRLLVVMNVVVALLLDNSFVALLCVLLDRSSVVRCIRTAFCTMHKTVNHVPTILLIKDHCKRRAEVSI